MGAISSINLLKNTILVEQAQELVKIMQAKENLTTLCGLSREETALDFSGQHLGAGDAVLIANDITNMGAGGVSTVIMHKFPLPIQEIKAKAELDLSSKELSVLDAIVIAALLPLNVSGTLFFIPVIADISFDKGAILQFTFSGDSDDSAPVTMETSMVEAYFCGKKLGISGAIMVAAFLPKCT
jgi:hypothetical protein